MSEPVAKRGRYCEQAAADVITEAQSATHSEAQLIQMLQQENLALKQRIEDLKKQVSVIVCPHNSPIYDECQTR